MNPALPQQPRTYWLFRGPWWRRALVFLAGAAVLVGAFYAEEDWRGHRDWNRYVRATEALGESLDFLSYVPKPVPDEQNFAMAPIVQSLLLGEHPLFTNDFFARADAHVFHKNYQGDGRRHYEDLVAWQMAGIALQAGELNAGQNFESTKTDLAARQAAAPAVLEGMKPDKAAIIDLQLASGRPYSRYPINYDLEDPAQISIRHLARTKAICLRLNLRASAELAADQTEQALSDVKLGLYLADSIKTEPLLISYLVRVADFQIAIRAIWEGLAEHRWTGLQLQELQKRLQEYDFPADLVRPLKMERAFGIKEIAHYEKTGLGQLDDIYLVFQDGNIDNLGKSTWHKSYLDLLGRILPSGWYNQERLRYCTDFEAQIRGVFDLPAKRVFPGTNTSNYEKVVRHSPDPRSPGSLASIWHHRALTPDFGWLKNIPMKAAAAQTAANQAAIACALEEYRLTHGKFPETLETLSPQFMPRPPNDVITGQPYKYRRTQDGQFVLYSVGWNETDDGGVPGKKLFDDKGDWVWEYPAQ